MRLGKEKKEKKEGVAINIKTKDCKEGGEKKGKMVATSKYHQTPYILKGNEGRGGRKELACFKKKEPRQNKKEKEKRKKGKPCSVFPFLFIFR